MNVMGTKGFLVFLSVMVLSGCATVPTGPSVMVLPSREKPFEAFQEDDALCRQWALQQAGMEPGEAVREKLISGAAVGTLIGTGAGAAIGAAAGSAGAGAAIGAGTGLLAGAAMASGPAYEAGWELQRRYDMAYQQCMYAKGNQIPGYKRSTKGGPIPPPPPPQWRNLSNPLSVPPGYPPPP
jgi:hypothetical protein